MLAKISNHYQYKKNQEYTSCCISYNPITELNLIEDIDRDTYIDKQ